MFLAAAVAGLPTWAAALPLVAPKGTVAQDDGRLWKDGVKRTRDNQWVPGVILSGRVWVSLAHDGSNTHGVSDQGTLWRIATAGTVQIGTETDWVSVHAGGGRRFAIKSNGELWAAGNAYLGHPTLQFSSNLIRIGADGDWKSAAAGNFHNLAIRRNGTLWSWGYNSHGTLGTGNTTSQTTPVQVGTADTWTHVAAGLHCSLAIQNDGSLWSWGASPYGALGQGTTSGGLVVPTRIGTDNDWKFVSCSESSVLAIKQDGALWSWGGNPGMNMPQPVGTLTGWHMAVTDGADAIAVRQDGSIWAWGAGYQSTSPIDITQRYIPLPYIAMLRDGMTLRSGSNMLDFGTAIEGEPTSIKLTVLNEGFAPLSITGLTLPDGFAGGIPDSIDPGQRADLVLQFDAHAPGSVQGIIQIRNNDPSLPEFKLNASGTVVSGTADTDGDGLNDAAELAMQTLGFNWKVSDPSRVADFFSKAQLLDLFRPEDVDEIGVVTEVPALSPGAGTPLEIGLSFQSRHSSSPVPLAPGDLQITTDGALQLSIPNKSGKKHLFLTPAP
jgi:hypothetical protein